MELLQEGCQKEGHEKAKERRRSARLGQRTGGHAMTDPYDNLSQTSEMVSALAREINNIREKMFRQQDEIARLTAERDEARADAERWQDDALRLLKERNAAQTR
jgi:predicted RNase H-like nuclease (RuvC/YqgF family)